MKFIDLFAGIGGFRYGLENIRSIKSNNTKRSKGNDSIKDELKQRKRLDYQCVYSNEWDKYASQIYKKHYGECDTRDITTVPASDIPDHDLICGGFPCQSFSIAGKRLGFEDTRGTLFYDIVRIAKHKRPRYLLLENVKGLLSHDEGKTFQTILGVLADIGYTVEWQVLNSKNFGVPQNRERVFIVGHLGGGSGRKVFPIKATNKTIVATTAIDSNYWKGIDNHGQRTAVFSNKPNTQKRGDKSNNINAIRRTSYTNDMRIRRLTPTECERLQGFPDGWTEGLSDTQRYKCLGNAITTNVVTEIGKKLND